MSFTSDRLEELIIKPDWITIDVPAETPTTPAVNQCNLAITFVKFKMLKCDKCDTEFQVGAIPNYTLRCEEHDYDECASCVTTSTPNTVQSNKPIHDHQLMFIACATEQNCDGPCAKSIKRGHYASVCSACKVYFCRPCLHASVHSAHRTSTIVAPSPDIVRAYVRGDNDIRPVPTVIYDKDGVAFEIRHE